MRLHLVFLSVLLGSILVQSQVLIPGLRTLLTPVLTNGQIRPVSFLDIASTVTPDTVREQFSRRQMNLAKPLVPGTPAQTQLPKTSRFAK